MSRVAKVVITDTVFPSIDIERRVLGDLADVVLAPAGDERALREIVRDADAILNCYAPLSAELVEGLERCRIIARYGIGLDTIPVDIATAAGIVVTNVPDYCIDEVSDHALALLLSLARGVAAGVRSADSGHWELAAVRPLRRLRGRTLGLLGFGRIARALAAKAAPLGLRLIAFDPFVPAERIRAAGVAPTELTTLLQEADFISVHVPLGPNTRHLISEDSIRLMKPSAVLINTARGAVVDTVAVLAALREGRLGGAALDVLEREPPEDWRELVAPGLILTPHVAFYSEESLIELQTRAAEEVARVLRGEPPQNAVNADQMPARF